MFPCALKHISIGQSIKTWVRYNTYKIVSEKQYYTNKNQQLIIQVRETFLFLSRFQLQRFFLFLDLNYKNISIILYKHLFVILSLKLVPIQCLFQDMVLEKLLRIHESHRQAITILFLRNLFLAELTKYTFIKPTHKYLQASNCFLFLSSQIAHKHHVMD